MTLIESQGAPTLALHPVQGAWLSGPGLDVEMAVDGRRRDPRTDAGTPGDTSQLSVVHSVLPHKADAMLPTHRRCN